MQQKFVDRMSFILRKFYKNVLVVEVWMDDIVPYLKQTPETENKQLRIGFPVEK